MTLQLTFNFPVTVNEIACTKRQELIFSLREKQEKAVEKLLSRKRK